MLFGSKLKLYHHVTCRTKATLICVFLTVNNSSEKPKTNNALVSYSNFPWLVNGKLPKTILFLLKMQIITGSSTYTQVLLITLQISSVVRLSNQATSKNTSVRVLWVFWSIKTCHKNTVAQFYSFIEVL